MTIMNTVNVLRGEYFKLHNKNPSRVLIGYGQAYALVKKYNEDAKLNRFMEEIKFKDVSSLTIYGMKIEVVNAKDFIEVC